MRKLVSCEFNIDTACVELRYADGEAISIYVPGIEDSLSVDTGAGAEALTNMADTLFIPMQGDA